MGPGFKIWVEINIPHLENDGSYSKDFIPFMPLTAPPMVPDVL